MMYAPLPLRWGFFSPPRSPVFPSYLLLLLPTSDCSTSLHVKAGVQRRAPVHTGMALELQAHSPDLRQAER